MLQVVIGSDATISQCLDGPIILEHLWKQKFDKGKLDLTVKLICVLLQITNLLKKKKLHTHLLHLYAVRALQVPQTSLHQVG